MLTQFLLLYCAASYVLVFMIFLFAIILPVLGGIWDDPGVRGIAMASFVAFLLAPLAIPVYVVWLALEKSKTPRISV